MRGALALALLLTACDLPRDTEGTTDHVRGGAIRIGWVAGEADADALRPLIARLARDLHARPAIVRGGAEPLLARLEEGRLDLVLGTFDATPPWEGRVTYTRALRRDGTVEAKAAVRPGEHRWLMTVDRAIAALPDSPPR